MKKIILCLLVLAFTLPSHAQIQTPQPSPFSKIEQKVGLTDVTVAYSRPGAKGRKVFGDLVPFDKMWRTGANKNTIITFSDPIEIGGSKVAAGTYAIFTKPSATSWEVYFYADAENWGTPQNWDDAKVAAKVTVAVQKLPLLVETYTMMFSNLTNEGAAIDIVWENTSVTIPFTVPTMKNAMKSIETVMAGPSAGDYYSAASFYLDANKDLDKALTWISKAIELRPSPAFWYHRRKALILAAKGDKKAAVAEAKTSLALAETAGNADYVKMNKESIAKWNM
jgi:hypothetical protein